MEIKKCEKKSFAVIGKEGSTLDGAGFIQRLWDNANSHFGEVRHLAKKDANGNLAGIWGAMSDFSRSFSPWEDFSKGLYLAGVECNDDTEAPDGWAKAPAVLLSAQNRWRRFVPHSSPCRSFAATQIFLIR